MKITELEKGTRKAPPHKAGNGGKEMRAAEPRRLDVPNPLEEMERLFASLVPRSWLHSMPWDWPAFAELGLAGGRMPRVDVLEREHELVVRAELPGVEKKDIDISLRDANLTIKAETHHEKREEQGDFHRCEIARGSFTRTVLLPASVDSEKATARFDDGLLELVLPKIEKSPRRKVPVG